MRFLDLSYNSKFLSSMSQLFIKLSQPLAKTISFRIDINKKGKENRNLETNLNIDTKLLPFKSIGQNLSGD